MSVGDVHSERGVLSRSTAARRPMRGVFGGQAWEVGEFAGIRVAIDHSWVLIAALISFSLASHFGAEYPHWGPVATWATALATSALFFLSLLLHEFGHSLTAQRLGVRVTSITLFVFGGVAQLASEPQRPRDEIVIAIAGPLVSAALALIFSAIGEPLAAGTGASSEMLAGMFLWLGRINWMLALFNCIPGFPLDGGRVLRGVLWALTGSFERATRHAAASGSFIAYGLILLGIVSVIGGGQIVGGLWLAFIGWFLLSAARSSVGQVVLERILSRVRIASLAERVDDAIVDPATSVESLVADAVLGRGVRTFYAVGARGELVGLVSLQELAGVGPTARATTRVQEIMRPASELACASPDENAWIVLKRMAERGVNQLPVLDSGRLLGAVTRERLLTVVQAGLALDSTQR